MSRLRLNRIGRQLMASDEDISALLARVHQSGGARIGDLLPAGNGIERANWLRTIGWLAKMDILRVVQ